MEYKGGGGGGGAERQKYGERQIVIQTERQTKREGESLKAVKITET